MFRKPLKILMVQTMNMNLGDSILADNDCYLMKKAMGFKRCDLLRYSISSRDFSQVRYVDAVVFAGGIIKCTNENFWQYMPEIIKEADKYNVPVFSSAIGVEKFYENDERSVALKAALNLPCVKGISVRDDVETLKRDYIENKDIKIYSVYDPAVWCADTYKKHLAKKPNICYTENVWIKGCCNNTSIIIFFCGFVKYKRGVFIKWAKKSYVELG